MPPEKFKIANAVVKAESTLLSLLESTSNLSYEEKTKVVDRIHVQKKKKKKKEIFWNTNKENLLRIWLLTLLLYFQYLTYFMV